MSHRAYQTVVLVLLSLLLFLATAILGVVVETNHRTGQTMMCYDAGFDTARCVPGEVYPR